MEEAVFLRELNKYKVVRREDQHKVLWNKRETGKLTAPAGSSAREAREPAAKKTAPPSAPSDFWAAMAEACQPKLKEAEVRQLLAAMRAEHRLVPSKVCLEDLEVAAELLTRQ